MVAGGAALLARRDRLSLALAVVAGLFVLAGLTLHYEIGQQDVTRLDGHARNFALLAVLLAVSLRMRALRPRWRWAAGAVVVGLVTWPTVVSPLRAIGPGLDQGVLLANATGEAREAEATRGWPREVYPRLRSARLADYIQSHTDIRARVLSPHPTALSTATGRPNASGFIQAAHLLYEGGPEHQDAVRYLEPAPVRRLGIGYVHAPDAWVAGLPERARRWLDDPRLFDRLFEDAGDTFYRVRAEFLELEVEPAPASYEALRRAVPASAVVFVDPAIESTFALRAASTLAHARLVGQVFPGSHAHADRLRDRAAWRAHSRRRCRAALVHAVHVPGGGAAADLVERRRGGLLAGRRDRSAHAVRARELAVRHGSSVRSRRGERTNQLLARAEELGAGPLDGPGLDPR